MNKNQLVSPAKIENIPVELKPLSADILKLVDQVYAKYTVLSVNWHGSIPRGEFVFGESDADFDVIVKKPLQLSHRKERGKLTAKLTPKWQKLGVTQIDISAMSSSELHDRSRLASLFFDFTDGIEITNNKPVDLSFVLPKTTEELVGLLCGSYGLWIHDVETGKLDDDLAVKQLTKRSIRAIYGLAMLNGAPYERNWRKYGPDITKFTPQYSKTYNELCSSKKWSVAEILALATQVRDELIDSDIKLLQDWPNKK